MRRRDFIVGAGGLVLLGSGVLLAEPSASTDGLAGPHPFPGAKLVGNVRFLDEVHSDMPLDTPIGEGQAGRVLTDLSKVQPHVDVPPRSFYVRTRAPGWVPSPKGWTIKISGLVKEPKVLPISQVLDNVNPIGEHLLECSGNYGGCWDLISTTSWKGVPLRKVLAWAQPASKATHLMVVGAGRYAANRPTSWIFPIHQNAYLATHMGGQPLLRDHGAPVRMLVPNWYGCCNIKWVNELRFVTADEPPTDHMLEYASRTQQDVPPPSKGSQFRPGLMNLTAMPIRLERWQHGKDTFYRLVGIIWGGQQPASDLQIRIVCLQPRSIGPWRPVDVYHPPKPWTQSWTFWYHHFKPAGPGRYGFLLQTPGIASFRMDHHLYVRGADIT